MTRSRRTAAEVQAIRDAIREVLDDDWPMTVRQVFYQLVSRQVIEKTERDYNNVVVRLLTQMRLDGDLQWYKLADATRWMRKPDTFDSIEDALEETRRHYRRSLWVDSDEYVEVWLEKKALAGVLYRTTANYDVPLMVSRGFASLSFLHESAEAMEYRGKDTVIYYFGDYDPSGMSIESSIERRLREFAPYLDITFERVAITPAQITEFNLPTRPTKATTHGRGLHEGESIEVDALPVAELRTLVRDVLDYHLDANRLAVLEAAEESERELIGGLPAMLRRSQAAKAAAGKRKRPPPQKRS